MRLTTLRGDARRLLTVDHAADVRSAMEAMNETGRTLVLVTSGERFDGVIADGDIRRHLAKGGSVDDPVGAVVNRTPTTLPHDTPGEQVREFMQRRGFDYVPLVDGDAVVALCVLEHAPPATALTAVILAGGTGSRLAPLTDDCPKPLLPLGGRPILGHIVDHLRDQGVGRFVLAVNHLAHMIVDQFDDGSDWNTFIEYVHETKALGTGGPLSLIDQDAVSDPFLCLNGDIISDLDVLDLRDVHIGNGWDATMVVHDHQLTVPYGVVESGAGGEFAGIAEKPVLSFEVNAGVYMLSKSALAVVPADEHYDMPSLFDDLRAKGMRGGLYRHRGRWIDIGTMSEYQRAEAIFDGGDVRWR